MPDTSMPMKIMLTGIQTLTSFQLSFSTVTTPEKPKRTTITELIKFCKEAYGTNQDSIWLAKFVEFHKKNYHPRSDKDSIIISLARKYTKQEDICNL